MNFLCILATIIMTIYLLSGILIFIQNRKRPVNILFSLIALSLAIWSFTAIIIYAEKDKQNVVFWYKLSSLGFAPFYALYLHFVLSLLKVKIKKTTAALLYLPSFILIYLTFTGVSIFKDFIQVRDQWIFIPAFDSISFYFYVSYYISYMLACLSLLFHRTLKTQSNREKKQIRIIYISFIISITIGTGDFILPKITFISLPALAPLSLSIFIICTWMAILKYNFLNFMPQLVADLIIETIKEIVILADPNLFIISVNKKLKDSIETEYDTLQRVPLEKVIIIDDSINEILKKFTQIQDGTDAHIVERIIYFRTKSNMPFKASFSLIKDQYKDIIGYLIIAREEKEIMSFINDFNITKKQMDIIDLCMHGHTNIQIGERLGITRRTVETHLNNIYIKLKISNKIELFNVLNRYNINIS